MKKILALVLVLCLCLTAAGVMAEEGTKEIGRASCRERV